MLIAKDIPGSFVKFGFCSAICFFAGGFIPGFHSRVSRFPGSQPQVSRPCSSNGISGVDREPDPAEIKGHSGFVPGARVGTGESNGMAILPWLDGRAARLANIGAGHAP